VIRNRRVSELRKQTASHVDESVDVSQVGGVDEELVGRERRAIQSRMREAIEELAPKYRDCIEMKYLKGHPSKKIAAVLNLPNETVRTRLRRGKARLEVI